MPTTPGFLLSLAKQWEPGAYFTFQEAVGNTAGTFSLIFLKIKWLECACIYLLSDSCKSTGGCREHT